MTWRWPALAALAATLVVIAFGFDFTVFALDARRQALPPERADGIVALTGGADRIETALHLLMEGRAPALLISGVGRGGDLADITRRLGVDPAAIADRVTIGRAATDTLGNAAETADWARRTGATSLIVVTAGYHMQRAVAEITRDLPGVVLYPVPVQPPALRGLIDLGTIRLLASEYEKLLAVRLGLNRLVRSKGARS